MHDKTTSGGLTVAEINKRIDDNLDRAIESAQEHINAIQRELAIFGSGSEGYDADLIHRVRCKVQDAGDGIALLMLSRNL